ncbi:hypothetical protein LCGC14_1710080 [marine sediment metagenome]|uniref:Uncharacterized protein n=1 Tax=marine sediment metagenome TaxID=412755 RepID=A0A0F9I329_9ZZZZ
MLNIILGKFLDKNFRGFIQIFQTIKESSQSAYSKVERFIIKKVGNISEIISIFESREYISEEKGVIFSPRGENRAVTLLNKFL